MRTSDKRISQKAWEEAYEIIEQLILDTQLAPGEIITETAISERLGMSRTPVREAMQKLEEKGLIVSTNGRKRVHVLTIHEMEELFDLKICLEGQAVRWAIERGSEEDFHALGVIMAEMRLFVGESAADSGNDKKGLEQWLEIDRRLHQLIFKMAHAPKTEGIVHTLNRQFHRLKVGILTLEGRMHRSIQEHESFVKPMLEKNPETAEVAMKTHLDTVKHELVKLMGLFQYPA